MWLRRERRGMRSVMTWTGGLPQVVVMWQVVSVCLATAEGSTVVCVWFESYAVIVFERPAEFEVFRKD